MQSFRIFLMQIFFWSLVSAPISANGHGIFLAPICLVQYSESHPDLELFVEHLDRSIAITVPIEFKKSGDSDFFMTLKFSAEEPKKIQLNFRRTDSSNSHDNLCKEYVFENQPDLIAIANQWGDLVVEKVFGFKGSLSYPLAYVEVSPEKVHSIILSDLTRALRTALYSSSNTLISLSWSPDAKLLAFIEMAPQGPALKILDLHSLRIETVEDSHFVSSPCFSKDARFLYYLEGDNLANKLIKYDLISEKKEVVIVDGEWIIDVNTGWDEYHLLLSIDRTGKSQIYEYNIINKKFKRLTFSHQECVHGSLNSPNNSLFYSLLTEGHSLLMRRSFSDHQTHYVTIEGEAEGITTPPGPYIIGFERNDYRSQPQKNIVLKSLLTGQETILDCPYDCYSPSWAPQPGIINLSS